MITLTQDSGGFVRMSRHFPITAQITVFFTVGSSEVFSGGQLNAIYDEARAVFRAQNRLDAKGFSRGPAKTVQPSTDIAFVAIHAGMSSQEVTGSAP